jgi:hypothetical protein
VDALRKDLVILTQLAVLALERFEALALVGGEALTLAGQSPGLKAAPP